jgi:16S rRNA (cytidine1402-2'-O)-methyltransferase
MGNLADISQRALDVLARVTLIAAEDTRHTAGLLAHYGLNTPLTPCHEHNEEKLVPRLLGRLAAGDDLALVSDAGTPLISDPGYPLVAAARATGIKVVPIPGPNAAICALSAAGLPSDRFLFLGFPPRAGSKRRDWIASLAREPGTLVFYEAGNRVLETLADLATSLGLQRRAVVARELTKRFETFLTGTLADLPPRLRGDPDQQKGEFVLLVEGSRDQVTVEAEGERVLAILAREFPLKQAAALAAEVSGDKKNRLYKLALAWRRRGGDISTATVPDHDR